MTERWTGYATLAAPWVAPSERNREPARGAGDHFLESESIAGAGDPKGHGQPSQPLTEGDGDHDNTQHTARNGQELSNAIPRIGILDERPSVRCAKRTMTTTSTIPVFALTNRPTVGSKSHACSESFMNARQTVPQSPFVTILRWGRWVSLCRPWLALPLAALIGVLLVDVEHVSAQERTSLATPSRFPTWLSVDGSLRVRPEGRQARRFVENDNASYFLTQLRLGVGLRAGRLARFYIEAQDSRAPGLPGAGTTLRDPLDLYQGYAELGTPDGRLTVRVGRQEMAYGQQRLISVNPWRNTGRSFDAARAMIGNQSLGVDLFAAAIVGKNQDGFDGWEDGETLYGGYGRLGHETRGLRLEPYLLVRNRRVTDRREVGERRAALGTRIAYRFAGPIDLAGEAVRQFGQAGEASIAAWMAYGIVGYDLPNVAWRPRLEWEYSYASGDPDADDGRLEGFDTMYSTPHRYYGYADLIGGRNIRDARVSVSSRPAADLSVSMDLHRFWLATRRDGLYDTTLKPVFTVPSGLTATSDVGVELDVTVTYLLRGWLTIGGGWSRFLLGQLLETAASGRASTFTYGVIEARS